MRNLVILGCGGMLERLLGATYRILLARAAGPAALGLIQYCLPILRLSLVLGTLGLPQALTRVIAEALARKAPEDAHAALAWSLRRVLVLGGTMALALLTMAPLGRHLFPDPRVVPLLRWLAPILLCDCVALILQANFQARNRMWPVAAAGLVGQGGKLAVSLLLLGRAAPGGVVAMAAAALAAVAVSEAAALVLLLVVHGRPTLAAPAEQRSLLPSSLPLMGDGLVFAVAGAIDVLVIPRRLIGIGLTREAATALMGQAWGMALPALFLPMVAVWPIAYVTLPAIADGVARGDRAGLRRQISLTYLAVGAIALTASVGFSLLAGPIVTALYACPSAAPYLRLFALAALPIYLASIGGTILIGLNLPMALFRQSLACATLRVFLIYILTGMPRLGIAGAVIAIATANGLLALANGWTVYRRLGRCPESSESRVSESRVAGPPQR